jgi:ABC-type amino acid transport system permease subunit
MKNPNDWEVLAEVISKEPLGIYVRQGDENWALIGKWMHFALLTANRLREWAWQGAFLAVIAAIIWFFASNTAENLARRNVPFGLSVLWKQAGFDIPFKLVEWQTTYSYGHAV